MKQIGKTAAFWAAVLFVFELVFHITVYQGLSSRILSAVLFTLAIAALLTALSHAWKWELANKITRYVLVTALVLIFGVQTVYYKIFDSMLSLAYVGMGGEAIMGFLPMVFEGILNSLPQLIVYLLPYPVLAVLQKKKLLDAGPVKLRVLAVPVCCCAVLFLLGRPARNSGPQSLVYYDANATVERQTAYFGLLSAERLEIKRMLFPSEMVLSGTDLTRNLFSDADNPGAERNIMPEIDFAALEGTTDNETFLELNNYFAGLAGTTKNEYTGLFEGYNLIEICAEAFSPYLVSEERTPTLYRLMHEGIIFENFYNSFPAITTNGEYGMCMGLLPDGNSMSFTLSIENYVPFTLAHRFQEIGGSAWAYHNNVANFYSRIATHANMGYQFFAIGNGLDMEILKPNSDYIMMQKTVDDYIDQEPFVVHYMTYSGHGSYDYDRNEMSAKNRHRVQDMTDIPEQLQAYYACSMELEDAMAYLVQRLEEAGIADHTVIVLSTDHYPYSLDEENYAILAGEDVVNSDPFWKYRNSFICWTGGLDEPIYVDDYCCTQDILPTLCNLFGLEYDSRLLTGTDVFSDSTHLAVLSNGSFVTDQVRYDGDSGKITYLVDKDQISDEDVQRLIQGVQDKFSVSTAILRNDYYRYVFSTLDLADTESATDVLIFPDIEGKWYEAEVGRLNKLGVLMGGGNFRGEDYTNRVQMYVMVARGLGMDQTTVTPPYTDCSTQRWYSKPVAALWSVGVLPDTDMLYPYENVTRADAEEFFAAAANYAGIRRSKRWAENMVEEVLEQAAAEGEDLENFTRGTIAVMVDRFLTEVNNG